MANIDFWIQRPWNKVKRYVGLNTNKLPLDSLNDDFLKNPTWLLFMIMDLEWYLKKAILTLSHF